MTQVRWAGVVAFALAGCGRIGFSERTDDVGIDAAPGDSGGPQWSKIVAYARMTCGLHGGRAYCWGENASGQRGDGTLLDSAVPRAVLLPPGEVNDLSIGEDDGCAIVDGNLYCYGAEIGSATPVAIPLGTPATAVAVGHTFGCVLATNVQCWGENDAGQLATGGMQPRTTPGPITWSGTRILAIDAGDDHTCVLDDQMFAHCWGHNDHGTLGTGSFQPTSALTPVPVITTVRGLPHIAGWHACAITNGAVDCWGQGTGGELGDGMGVDRATPGPVPLLASNVTAVATGGGPMDPDATCAIMSGKVYCWGDGRFGRLGDGLSVNQPAPVAVAGLPGPAEEIAVGYSHACARLTDGDVWCWGRGSTGELGNGSLASSQTPVRVVDP